MNGTNKLRGFLFALVCLLLIAIVIYSGFRFLGATVFFEEETDADSSYVSKTIERDGVKYFPKQDIETLLVIGVDVEGPMEKITYAENNNMADAIMLLIFDKGKEKVNVLSLNRDTMTKVPVRDDEGHVLGTAEMQLAVSYAYGDGMERSCENTMKAVSMLLNGNEPDHFVAMNMDAIAMINDAVGGVTVDVVDNFSEVDPSIPYGRITLKGDQALTFIRARKGVGSQLNVSRMERQRVYMKSFFNALKSKVAQGKASSFAVDLYEDLTPYMVTDCSVTVMSTMMERYAAYDLGKLYIPEGENRKGEQYMEFYLDEEAFDELVVKLLYAKKN